MLGTTGELKDTRLSTKDKRIMLPLCYDVLYSGVPSKCISFYC
jgi:hypothetical protein